MKRRYSQDPQYLQNARIIDDLVKCTSNSDYEKLFKQILVSPALFSRFTSKMLELSPDGRRFGLDVWIKCPFGVEQICRLIPLQLVDERSDNIVVVLTYVINNESDESVFSNVICLINSLGKRKYDGMDRFYGVLLDNYDKITKFDNIHYSLKDMIPNSFGYFPNLWKIHEKYKLLKPYLSYATRIYRHQIPLSVYHSYTKDDIHDFELYRNLRFHLSKFLVVSDVIPIILKLVFIIQK